jgi:hypothetical protein
MHVKKNIIVMTLFFVIAWSGANAQNHVLEGRVVDASNGNPVEFANLGVLDTFLGDATDNNGYFSLELPGDLTENKIRVSAVGYRSKEIKISILLGQDKAKIDLFPAVYDIDEVDIEAPSRILYGMLKMVTRQVSENYYSGNYVARADYLETTDAGKRKLQLKYADFSGYGTRSHINAFENRSFRIVDGTRNFEYLPFEGGLHRVEELLGFDIVRNPGNILDNAFVDRFDVFEKEQYEHNGQSVIVIGFENSSPLPSFSGDARITGLEGEVHVVKDDMSVLKHRTVYFTNGKFRHGRSFLTDESLQQSVKPVTQYTVEVEYNGTIKGKKVLSKVSMQELSQTKNSSFELLFTDFIPDRRPENQNGRQYYDNISVYSAEF